MRRRRLLSDSEVDGCDIPVSDGLKEGKTDGLPRSCSY